MIPLVGSANPKIRVDTPRSGGVVDGPSLPKLTARSSQPGWRAQIGNLINGVRIGLRDQPLITATGVIGAAAAAGMLAARTGSPLAIGLAGVVGALAGIIGVGFAHKDALPTLPARGPGGERAPGRGDTLRVVTYNLHYLTGEDGGTATDADLDRVAEQIKALDPDILLLQEVRDFSSSGRYADQAAQLAERLKPNSAVWAETERRLWGNTEGSAVLTFHGNVVSDARSIGLDTGSRIPRRLTDTMVVTPEGRRVRAIAGHLSFDEAYSREIATVLGMLDQPKALDTPVILGADFNVQSDQARGKAEGEAFRARGFIDATAAAGVIDPTSSTFPRIPGGDIDRIYVHGASVLDARIASEARGVSDHVPVVADIKLDA